MEKLLEQETSNRRECRNAFPSDPRREGVVVPKVEHVKQLPAAPQMQEAQTESAQDTKFRQMRDLRRKIDVITARIVSLQNERRELLYGPRLIDGYLRVSPRGVAGLTEAGLALLALIIFGNALMFNVTILSISVPAFALISAPIFAYFIIKGVFNVGRAVYKELSSYNKGREIRRLEKEKGKLIEELRQLDAS